MKSLMWQLLQARLEEYPEFEYLRNILYQYMCGRQPLILVKVLSAIVKFTPEQVRISILLIDLYFTIGFRWTRSWDWKSESKATYLPWAFPSGFFGWIETWALPRWLFRGTKTTFTSNSAYSVINVGLSSLRIEIQCNRTMIVITGKSHLLNPRMHLHVRAPNQ